MTKGKKGIVDESEDFLENAKKLNRKRGEQDPVVEEAPKGFKDSATDLRHAIVRKNRVSTHD